MKATRNYRRDGLIIKTSMFNPGASIRVAAAAAAALFFVTASTSSPQAQGIPAVDRRITYIMPQWLRFLSGEPSALIEQR